MVVFTPDFYVPEWGEFFEIKGYLDGGLQRKLQAVIDAGKSITVLTLEEVPTLSEYLLGLDRTSRAYLLCTNLRLRQAGSSFSEAHRVIRIFRAFFAL